MDSIKVLLFPDFLDSFPFFPVFYPHLAPHHVPKVLTETVCVDHGMMGSFQDGSQRACLLVFMLLCHPNP